MYGINQRIYHFCFQKVLGIILTSDYSNRAVSSSVRYSSSFGSEPKSAVPHQGLPFKVLDKSEW